jgi:CubicO group peptidase (beta-lactamase class C family)
MNLTANRDPVDEAVAKGSLSGAVLLTALNGEVVQFDAIGLRDIATNAPMQTDTIFRLSSMGKVFTNCAALILMERGVLSLDDEISKWAPEFEHLTVLDASMEVLQSEADLRRASQPANRAVTIRDLMTHRSGFAYPFNTLGALRDLYGRIPTTSPDDYIAAIAQIPLLHHPGERMTYGHSIDILGLVLARIVATDLSELLQELLFRPLAMHDTGFAVPPEKRERLASLYRPRSGRLTANRSRFPMVAPPLCMAGDGIVSTASDFLNFVRMLMRGGVTDGVRVMAESSVNIMKTNTLSEVEEQEPFLGMPLWIGRGFGMGLFVVTDPELHRLFAWPASQGSIGWVGGYGTCWQADPDRDLILIYLSQDERALGTISEAGNITDAWWDDLMAVPFGCVMRTYLAMSQYGAEVDD